MEKVNAIAIITARGGSKRIPGKNIKDFNGKPIIAYSIEAAISANCFQEVMVSTDDEEIASVAKQYGAKIPFFRSKENSDDFSTTYDVLEEVLNEYENRGRKYDYCCCTYPTAPFITPQKIKKAFDLLLSTDADAVIPVSSYSYPIWRSLKIENNRLKMNWPEHLTTRSQDLPKAYHDCGQFYFFKCNEILKKKSLFTDNTLPMIIAESEVQDIDNEEDWKMAEHKYSFINTNN